MNSLEDLQRLLDRAAAGIPEKALRIIGNEGKLFISKNFQSESFTDTGSEKWKDRKTEDSNGRDITRYRTNRVGRAGALNRYGSKIKDRALLTGYDTGGNKLRNSYKYRISLGGKTVSFYTAKQYAQRHNEGLDKMPKRQHLGPSNYLNRQIGTKINSELDKIFR